MVETFSIKKSKKEDVEILPQLKRFRKNFAAFLFPNELIKETRGSEERTFSQTSRQIFFFFLDASWN